VKFVLEDLNSDPQFSGRERFFKPFTTNYSNSTNQWTVVVKITLSPHSECPVVLIRTYQLLPIRHGLDKGATENCVVGAPIVFEEEAIIASKAGLQVDFLAGAYACGYKLPLEEPRVLDYCPDANLQELREFASSAEGATWIVEWRAAGEKKLVALNDLKQILKTS